MNLPIPPVDVDYTPLLSGNFACCLDRLLLSFKAARDPDITGLANRPFFAPRHDMQAFGAHDLISGTVWKLFTTKHTGGTYMLAIACLESAIQPAQTVILTQTCPSHN